MRVEVGKKTAQSKKCHSIRLWRNQFIQSWFLSPGKQRKAASRWQLGLWCRGCVVYTSKRIFSTGSRSDCNNTLANFKQMHPPRYNGTQWRLASLQAAATKGCKRCSPSSGRAHLQFCSTCYWGTHTKYRITLGSSQRENKGKERHQRLFNPIFFRWGSMARLEGHRRGVC